MESTEKALDVQLQSALRAADDQTARYHLREALQLRIAEQESGSETVSS